MKLGREAEGLWAMKVCSTGGLGETQRSETVQCGTFWLKKRTMCVVWAVLLAWRPLEKHRLLQWHWRRTSWTFMRAAKWPAGGNVCKMERGQQRLLRRWQRVLLWEEKPRDDGNRREELWRERTRPVYVNWGDRWQMESPTVTGWRSRLLLLRMLRFSFPQQAAAHSHADLVTDVSSHAKCKAPILSQGCTLINPWQKEQHITPRIATACGFIRDKITCLFFWVQRYTLDPFVRAKKTQTPTKHPFGFCCSLFEKPNTPPKYLISFHNHNINSGNTNPENT